ncbi:MAG: transcriptional regulator [Desulfobulbaceae bacterium DB1]|nr:MAG: transcriptional regulator [Desulfobulbaceae bacterium DB1]
MKDFIRVMKALSDPNRVKIIKMLENKPLCVCEITAVLQLAQPTVSKHLKLLEDAGLVDSSKDGSWVNYRLAESTSSAYGRVMLAHMREWLDNDKSIKDVVFRCKTVDRCGIKAA